MASKEYRSWSFSDRSFLFAAAVSALWHLLWFFTITIDVNQNKVKGHKRPEIVSLGAVLDDAIFKTLIESRTEFSKAVYREPEEFVKETEIPQEVSERYVAGDAVSMPSHKSFISTLKQRIGGGKVSAEPGGVTDAASRSEDPFELSGDLGREQLIISPTEMPGATLKPGLVDPEFQLFVESSGKVTNVRLSRSTGDQEVDRAYEQLLYEWVFRPTNLSEGAETILTARVVFKISKDGVAHD